MQILFLILLVVACFCFAIAAFAPEKVTKPHLVPLGLLLFVLVSTIQMGSKVNG